jgi:hypothetical protein
MNECYAALVSRRDGYDIAHRAAEPTSGNELKKLREIGIGVSVVLVIAALANWRSRDDDSLQAATDRETVDCLTHQLTRAEKQRIAHFTAMHDSDSIRSIYAGIFPRCVVRNDQWDRSGSLIVTARQALKDDPEFRRLLRALTASNLRES